MNIYYNIIICVTKKKIAIDGQFHWTLLPLKQFISTLYFIISVWCDSCFYGVTLAVIIRSNLRIRFDSVPKKTVLKIMANIKRSKSYQLRFRCTGCLKLLSCLFELLCFSLILTIVERASKFLRTLCEYDVKVTSVFGSKPHVCHTVGENQSWTVGSSV